MFLDDASGARVRDALIAAAARGVRVSLLIDSFGSVDNPDFFRPLSEGGVAFCTFSPRWGRRYLLRNHQKLALADGRRVIIGGFNISDEYFGTAQSGAWRDLGLELEGERATSTASPKGRSTGCSVGPPGGSAPGRAPCAATCSRRSGSTSSPLTSRQALGCCAAWPAPPGAARPG
jgi:hypothetical protein